eukprot:jgi/Pico_ML_1/54937/g74.t1
MASAHRPTRVQAAALDMACGGMAGLAAKTAEAPVDRMKVLFQTGPDAFTWRSGAQVMGEVNAMYGGAAGLVGQTVVYPIETVRRRIQVMKRQALHAREGELVVATNATRVFFRVWKEEGTRGLYKGLSINFVKGPLALATSFTVFHWTKNAISDRGTRGSDT